MTLRMGGGDPGKGKTGGGNLNPDAPPYQPRSHVSGGGAHQTRQNVPNPPPQDREQPRQEPRNEQPRQEPRYEQPRQEPRYDQPRNEPRYEQERNERRYENDERYDDGYSAMENAGYRRKDGGPLGSRVGRRMYPEHDSRHRLDRLRMSEKIEEEGPPGPRCFGPRIMREPPVANF